MLDEAWQAPPWIGDQVRGYDYEAWQWMWLCIEKTAIGSTSIYYFPLLLDEMNVDMHKKSQPPAVAQEKSDSVLLFLVLARRRYPTPPKDIIDQFTLSFIPDVKACFITEYSMLRLSPPYWSIPLSTGFATSWWWWSMLYYMVLHYLKLHQPIYIFVFRSLTTFEV